MQAISLCVLLFLLFTAKIFAQANTNDKILNNRFTKLQEKIQAERENTHQKSKKGEEFDLSLPLFDRNASDCDDDYDPMTSRCAPPENNQSYTITEARLRKIRENFMYPYFDKGGDNDEGDYQSAVQSWSPQVNKNLNFNLPFFGFRYNYTRISLNGYLEFSDPPENYDSYPLVFPVKNWPDENDPASIGIFYSKCRIGEMGEEEQDQRKPGVYFRLEKDLGERNDQMGVEIRERVKWDIREGIVGADNFSPKHAIIVTWKSLSFAGGIASSLYRTNTFQLVLATDEIYTYAMFNYLNLTWTTHTEAGGDSLIGEGGVPAFVGFNAGNGTRSYEYKPYSQNSGIRKLTASGYGNNKQGRHYFRIDENIQSESCNADLEGVNLPLTFAPHSGNMLGGTVINITGPCFQPTDQVVCKFFTGEEVSGVVIDANRAICIQPPLLIEGYVTLEIAVGSGNYNWKGKYFVETPATSTEKIFFKDFSYYEKNPTEISITWEKYNLTTNDNAAIQMSLWGYRENSETMEFVFIDDIATDVQNTGSYKIIPSAFKNRNNEEFLDIQFGFIQINVTETKITHSIWSRPIPLSWYFAAQWERQYGEDWAQQLCSKWLDYDKNLDNFTSSLPECPCTLEQALTDKGRFMFDFECDQGANPRCYFNHAAVHCVVSGVPTIDGSEQQCCYDINHNLLLSNTSVWGSFPRRSHNLGYQPYNKPTTVPTLSQWYNDMVPRFTCCLWQDQTTDSCEALRFERRPSQDCTGYQAPAVAEINRDLIVSTFDGLKYSLNVTGDFELLYSESVNGKLQVQGRFEKVLEDVYGEEGKILLTSVAVREGTYSIIEVRLRPKNSRWRYHLDVLADGRAVYFDKNPLKLQHFFGVTVYTPSTILNQSEVVIMLNSGVGVQVLEIDGYLKTNVYLTPTYINETRGLFGNWNLDAWDDLTLPDGAIVPPPTDDVERINNEFCVKWTLDYVNERALFINSKTRTKSVLFE